MKIQKIAAFSDGDVGGNPAGVFIGDELPSDADMQRIAAEVGFSETVFAVSNGASWRVRYFSPEFEVPFCGHATIALGAALALRYVSQDTFLTDGTVAQNIAYGTAGASDADIAQAAKAAECTEFIDKLPLGFATRIGERGQKLSGGQRQRLALARAILKNPPVLILDEATSAVDNETEAAIQRSLEVVSRNRTTVVIAHRLSTVRQADCIHLFEDGRIVESGTHDELVARNARYAALWRLQTGERIHH
jgi:ABC-type branched-subunit amino acid transport system ATPase component